MTLTNKPPRGRPRNDAAREKVLSAARSLMADGGIGAVTIEALATMSGVTRPTIYRSWPNAQAVAMAALIAGTPRTEATLYGRSISKDLTRVIEDVVASFSSPSGRSAAALIATADQSTELAKAFRHQILLRTRETLMGLLRKAIEDGELRADLDVEIASDILLAPVFFRLLVGHKPMQEEFAAVVVRLAMGGFCDVRQ